MVSQVNVGNFVYEISVKVVGLRSRDAAERITAMQEKRYPATAVCLREVGTVRLLFALDRQGQLIDSRIDTSSGSTSWTKKPWQWCGERSLFRHLQNRRQERGLISRYRSAGSFWPRVLS
jgi:hypothetical protein